MRKISVLLLCLFGLCVNLVSQTTDIGNVRYSFSGAYAVVNKYLGGEEECVIPDKIDYNGLEYVVTKINSDAFGYTKVTGVKIPETVTTIGINAFQFCQNLSRINLPSSLTSIGRRAFYACYNLTQLIIPEFVNFDDGYDYFGGCSTLRTLIYLGRNAPTSWTATSNTYVPDLSAYSSPFFRINDAQIIEMISFDENVFDYTGSAPNPTWKNNVDGYTAHLSMPAISGEVGSHEEWIPVTFSKDGESFSTNVVYRYTINPVKVVAKVDNVSREYGEENPQFNITYAGLLNGDGENMFTSKPSITTTATKTSPVGVYSIRISGGSSPNYEFVYEPGTLTITKAPLTAKVNDVTKVYGSSVPSFSIEYSGLKNDETTPAWITSPTFKTDVTQKSKVGQYVIKAIGGVPKNYDLDSIYDGTMNVTPASLTIQAKDVIRQYYTDNPQFKYTCAGFVNGDDESVLEEKPILNTSASLKSDVGEYDISVSGAKSNNYDISFVNGKLSITPRVLSVSVGKYEKIYGEENPEFNVVYEGFVGDDNESIFQNTVKVETTATKESDVGTYPITIYGDSAINYTIFYTPGSLTINKAEQTIEWEQELDSLHVGEQVELTAHASSGLPITYTLNTNNNVELYQAGSKTLIDCIASGKLQIRAVQEGNKNYYSTPRISKNISIIDSDPNPNPNPNILKGDVNGDDKVDIADVVAVINIMAGL